MKNQIRSLAAILAIGFAIIPGAPAAAALREESPMPPLQTDWIGPLSVTAESLVVLEHDEKGTYLAVWVQETPVGPETVNVPVVSRSTDAAKTWSPPLPLWPLAQSSWQNLYPTNIVAAEDGTWIVTFLQDNFSSMQVNRSFIAITRDSGISWEPPINMSDKLLMTITDSPDPDSQSSAGISAVISTGDGQWMFRMHTYGVFANNPSYMIRSTDNAATFEPPVLLGEDDLSNFRVYGRPGSKEFLLFYAQWDPETHTFNYLSRFVYDNGTRFGPIMPGYVGGTDGRGNWLLLKRFEQYGDDSPRALHSTDSGVTLTPISAPPQLENFIDIENVSYSRGGTIMVIGNPKFRWDSVYLPKRAAVTRTTDKGNSWTPWVRLRDQLFTGNGYYAPPLEASDRNEFVTIISENFRIPGPIVNELYRFEGEPPPRNTAQDWQLFE